MKFKWIHFAYSREKITLLELTQLLKIKFILLNFDSHLPKKFVSLNFFKFYLNSSFRFQDI